MPDDDLRYDAIFWQYDINGDLTPRTAAADLNYPTEATVQAHVFYGVDDVYEGTLTVGSNPPAVPTLTIVDSVDGAHAVATIAGSSAATTNHVLTAVVSVDGLTFVDSGNRSEDGTVTLTLTPGRYWGQVKSDWAGGTSYSSVVYFEVTPLEEETAYDYRVKDIFSLPGDKVKTLVLERITGK